ncbi:MAG: VOC family protein [Leptospirillia bacterium]
MGAVLDHTILRVADMGASIRFYTEVLGFSHDGPMYSWEVIRVNTDLTIDLAEGDPAPPRHFAFAMDRDAFDAAFTRIRNAGIPYGNSPRHRDNMKGPGRTAGSRGMADAVYVDDPSGHIIEIRSYA